MFWLMQFYLYSVYGETKHFIQPIHAHIPNIDSLLYHFLRWRYSPFCCFFKSRYCKQHLQIFTYFFRFLLIIVLCMIPFILYADYRWNSFITTVICSTRTKVRHGLTLPVSKDCWIHLYQQQILWHHYFGFQNDLRAF